MTTENIHQIKINNKEIILIGTAHVSKKSAEQVKEVIENEKPDTVCVELDEQRYKTIVDGTNWKKTDIFSIIKQKKSTFLLINLVISSFQKRIARQFGVKPGEEMIQGIQSAKDIDATLVLADRNIQITFSRIWKGIGLRGKAQLLTQIFFGIFDEQEISEEELERLKSDDVLSSMLDELTKSFPRLKTYLVDERDQYLAKKIKDAPGNKIVAVLGAAHIPGVLKEIHREHDLSTLSQLPAQSKIPRMIGWAIPIVIVGAILSTFYLNRNAGVNQTISWILWNAILSSIGAIAAFAHPLSILTALVVAPLTSLNPLLAAGWFAGIVEAYIRKPSVEDFEALSEDVYTLKGFWRNKVTRILLVIALTNLGSTIGTFIGGAEVVRIFIKTILGA